MNEWQHLSAMTTNTRKYLHEPATQKILMDMATKMANIELMKRRQERHAETHNRESSWSLRPSPLPPPPSHPSAVELPVYEETIDRTPPQHYRTPGNPPYPDQLASSQDKFVLVPGESTPPRLSADLPYRGRDEKMVAHQPPNPSSMYNPSQMPPPRPPKTPINEPSYPARPPQRISPGRPNGGPRPPYPEDDEPPPQFNRYKKPEYIPRS